MSRSDQQTLIALALWAALSIVLGVYTAPWSMEAFPNVVG